jgi:hypothetical protein
MDTLIHYSHPSHVGGTDRKITVQDSPGRNTRKMTKAKMAEDVVQITPA